mmetsp:Transcript_11056/g.38487  ORF Transcript_11056/g.38487 Transcript_11056/m.38487 type:complete len:228 (-) Transcript_11056:1079-1762(-)
MAGNSSTSRMLFLSARNMVMRSMPMPQPAVGGRPYSSATQKPSSWPCASSSPAALFFIWSTKRSRCTRGLFSSVYALTTSKPAMKHSKRSVRPGSARWYLASGDISSGWSVMKVGLMQSTSMKSPTSLSSRRAVVRGAGHLTSFSTHRRSRKSRASSVVMSAGILMPIASSRPLSMGTRRKGGVKSISITLDSSPSASLGVYLILYVPWISYTMPLIISSVTRIRSA